MKRFHSPLTKILKLRTQEKRLSQMVLARRRTEHEAIEAELVQAETQARQTSSLIGRTLERSLGGAELQAVLQGLESQERQVQTIRERYAKAAESVAEALDDLHDKTRRERAVEHLLQEQRETHRREAIRDQQAALDDHSGRLWHQARLKAAEVG